ncbi:hypothetical protein F4775DRAFT_595388 [Biscogniauxia sp. FL1348]|nr:hypothetical protein F4775DRAFT_595388 [Biscogniauxia sp. FL1348]
MQQTGRRRRVLTCMPCYTRKQKCNRQYPCGQCNRRRRPEECVYNSMRGLLPGDESQSGPSGTEPSIQENGGPSSAPYEAEHRSRVQQQHSALAQSFGYFEDSTSNTMALLRELIGPFECDLNDACDPGTSEEHISPSIERSMTRDLERMPHREVIDFLIEYFVTELNWMKQIIHPPSFLMCYQQWWAKDKPLSIADYEFAALIARICSYATQFLPSPSHTVDSIRGLPLFDIRNTCSDIGDRLAKACLALDWKGSPVRVQHILFAALKFSCEGRTDRFWEGIACASRAAQKAGMHTATSGSGKGGADELGKEVQRRTFCSLYVLDSHLSRQLDRVPFLPDDMVSKTLPRLRLVPEMAGIENDAHAPEMFTERLMQVQLGRFWRSLGPTNNSGYDPADREQRYERFRTEYLPTLSPPFALEPDTKWDERLPKLPMQRQLLRIAIFDSICWNFRPLLLLKPSYISTLPLYKQVLLQSQKKRLVMAALKVLDAVSALHSMFGGSYTRFSAIIFNTFEAAILLLRLCSYADFPFDQGEHDSDILGLKVGRLTREKSMHAVETALGRLQMLAKVSDMASAGARVMAQLFIKALENNGSAESTTLTESTPSTQWSSTLSNIMGAFDDSGQWVSSDQWSLGFTNELLSITPQEGVFPDTEHSNIAMRIDTNMIL